LVVAELRSISLADCWTRLWIWKWTSSYESHISRARDRHPESQPSSPKAEIPFAFHRCRCRYSCCSSCCRLVTKSVSPSFDQSIKQDNRMTTSTTNLKELPKSSASPLLIKKRRRQNARTNPSTHASARLPDKKSN
jgi:hypothetical protein